MMDLRINIVEVEWDGPFNQGQFNELNTKSDYGLYQPYGTHEIYGPQALLYIHSLSNAYYTSTCGDFSPQQDDII